MYHVLVDGASCRPSAAIADRHLQRQTAFAQHTSAARLTASSTSRVCLLSLCISIPLGTAAK